MFSEVNNPGRGARPATDAVTPPGLKRTLPEVLDSSVARFGARALFLTKADGRWTETTYNAFKRLVDNVRGGLAALGVRAGDRVGLVANNRIEWAAIAYASYGLGAAVVPMYESQSDTEWAFIVRDAGVRVVFVADARIYRALAPLIGTMPNLTRVIPLDPAVSEAPLSYAAVRASGVLRPAPTVPLASSAEACLLYTSGTTGEPKGVVLTHANIVSNLQGLYSVIPLSHEHRTLSFLPWAHALGHTVELHMIIASGASTGIAEAVDKIVDNFVEVRPTVLVAVPRVFLRIYAGVEKLMASKPRLLRWLYRRGVEQGARRAAGERLKLGGALLLRLADRVVFSRVRARFGGRLEFAVSGAAALPPEVAAFMGALGITVYEGYGLTETSPIVSANVPGRRRAGSVGVALPGVRVVIDRKAGGRDEPDSTDGEIIVYGPNVMRGYHNREAETRAMIMPDGGLRTGDLGRLDGDGFLYITGRIKEQYKLSNGKYVVPAPLEEALKLSPFIDNVIVHGDNRASNVALIVPNLEAMRAVAARSGRGAHAGEELIARDDIRDKVRQEIERIGKSWKGYERIRAFAFALEDFTQENGMLTPSLKLKRRVVLARHQATIDALHNGLVDPG